MALFAIGDLHLSLGADKPMDVFGGAWDGYVDKLRAGLSIIGPEDTTVLCGDLSWGMELEAALPDFRFIAAIPGRKILLKGNHDYWWSGITQVRCNLSKGMYALQNDALAIDDVVLCGTRGWTYGSETAEDKKIYAREVLRLELSLTWAKKQKGSRLIAMTHYPPLGEKGEETPMSRLLSQYGVEDTVYGHLHGASLRGAVTGLHGGVRYHCVSCDGLGFRLYHLPAAKVADAPIETTEKA